MIKVMGYDEGFEQDVVRGMFFVMLEDDQTLSVSLRFF